MFLDLLRAQGTVSEILNVFIRDSTKNVSTIGLANVSASSVNFSWCRNNQATISSGVCSSNTVVGTYSTNALTQISSTSSLGWYQYGAPNGIFASGGSAVVKLFSAQAAQTPVDVIIDLLGNLQPVSVSTMATPVGVSSASVDFGVSTIAVSEKLVGVSTIAAAQKLVGVSTMTTPVGVSSASVNLGVSTLSVPVGVSSYSRDAGVSTIAVAEKLVGVSTIAVAEKLVGVSTIAVGEKLVGVSTISAAQKLVGVSTLTTPAGVSSASVNLGVSTLASAVEVSTMSTPVGVSSASVNLGVSTVATSVDVSSMSTEVGVSSSIMVSSNIVQINNVPIVGDGFGTPFNV